MKIALIGNGPSQILWHNEDFTQYDLVVGCNFSRYRVDVSVFADAAAAKLLRPTERYGYRVGSFQIVLGQRAKAGLDGFKWLPGGTISMAGMLQELGHLEDVVEYYHLVDPVASQSAYTSGHLAVLWICKTYENPEINMFGFDSLMGRSAIVSTSMEDVREDPRRYEHESEAKTADLWVYAWHKVLGSCKYDQIVIHGYEGDPEPPFEGVKNVTTRLHQQKPGSGPAEASPVY